MTTPQEHFDGQSRVLQYLHDGHFVEAREYCRTLLATNKSNPVFLTLYGGALRGCREFADAIECIELSISISNDAGSWQELGKCYIDMHDLSEAENCLRKSLALEPQNCWTLVYLANVSWQQNRMEDAERFYTEAYAESNGSQKFAKWLDEFLVHKSTLLRNSDA